MISTRHCLVAVACLTSSAGAGYSQENENCIATPAIFNGTTLANVADRYFGDIDYRYAIMLATNTRSGSSFPYIGNPNQLPVGQKLCVPAIAEAERLRNRFLTYIKAVQDMALPEPSERSNNLTPIDTTKPATAVSWVRASQAQDYQANLGKTIKASGDIWVTLVPRLREFCTGYVKTQGGDLASLTLRVEQRLGMPPQSAKSSFVEFEVANPGNPDGIFRPCASADVTTKTCELGPPKACDVGAASAEQCHRHRDFFLNQYYTSYGVSLPTEYPWTSLGYTFDWASGPVGLNGKSSFVVYGESEYVIPKGASVTVKAVYSTAEYCRAR
ncbi:MAG: hypothetical protein WCE79_04710 [Xanthobacteraceae bacterium]